MNISISPGALQTALRREQPPLLIDVRRRAAFVGTTDMIRGALRRNPESAMTWAGTLPAASSVVVYCVHGREVSQATAAALRASGTAASFLDGSLVQKPANSPTRWITRERPKIDRIACPWLITRFIDADAEFVYVPTPDVLRTGINPTRQHRPWRGYLAARSHTAVTGLVCDFLGPVVQLRRRS